MLSTISSFPDSRNFCLLDCPSKQLWESFCQIIKTKTRPAPFGGLKRGRFGPLAVIPIEFGPWAGLKAVHRKRGDVTMATKQHSSLSSTTYTHQTPQPFLLSSDSFGVPAGEERGQGWLHLSARWASVPSATGAERRGRKARAEKDGN